MGLICNHLGSQGGAAAKHEPPQREEGEKEVAMMVQRDGAER